jgi:hypothetical protein
VPAEHLQPLNKNAFAIGELLALPADMRKFTIDFGKWSIRTVTIRDYKCAISHSANLPPTVRNGQSTFGGSPRKLIKRENPGLFSPGVPELSLILGSRQYGGVSGMGCRKASARMAATSLSGDGGCHPVRLTHQPRTGASSYSIVR